MLAKQSSTASGLEATRGLVSNPKKVVSNGGKISVKGKHSVTSGANACCLHPHASYLVLSTVDRNGNTVTHPESLITRTGDIKVFTIEARDGMSTLRDILDNGYRHVDVEAQMRAQGLQGPVNVTWEYYRRHMARIEVWTESTSGGKKLEYYDDDAYICGDRCISRHPRALIAAFGLPIVVTSQSSVFWFRGPHDLNMSRNNVRVNNTYLEHIWVGDVYSVVSRQAEKHSAFSNVLGVNIEWKPDSRTAAFTVLMEAVLPQGVAYHGTGVPVCHESGEGPVVNCNGRTQVNDRWQPRYTRIAGTPRSPEAYNLIIDQFDVDHRYTRNNGQTFCSFFVQDVSRAMVAPLSPNANSMGDFLARSNNNPNSGWRLVTPREAQDRANEGYLTVASEVNRVAHPLLEDVTIEGTGHVAIVRPEQGPEFVFQDRLGGVPVLANAGSSNFSYGSARQAWSTSREIFYEGEKIMVDGEVFTVNPFANVRYYVYEGD